MTNDKKSRGRPTEKTQTPERIYFNTRINLGHKTTTAKITEEEYKKQLSEAKIKMIQERLNNT
jgi:hypothetical protein